MGVLSVSVKTRVKPVNSSWFSDVPVNDPKTRVHGLQDVQSVIEHKSKLPHSSFTYARIKDFEVPKRRAFFLTEYSRLYGVVFPAGTLCLRPFGDNLYCVIPADFGDKYSYKRSNVKAFHFTREKVWEYESPVEALDIRVTLGRILMATNSGDETAARYSETEMAEAFQNRFEKGSIRVSLYKVTYAIKGRRGFAEIKATSLAEAENLAKARYPHVENVRRIAV